MLYMGTIYTKKAAWNKPFAVRSKPPIIFQHNVNYAHDFVVFLRARTSQSGINGSVIHSRYAKVLRNLEIITAICALVAVPAGSSLLSPTPLINPFAFAQETASSA